MKNPLNKRLLRELKADYAKYLVIFLFMVMLISLVSAFLISDDSYRAGYDEGFIKYNIEDGHIAFNKEPSVELLEKLEKAGDFKFCDLRYVEEDTAENGSTIRVYKNRKDVDLASLWEGTLPVKDNEIALDRMYAENNGISSGSTVTLNNKKLTVSGLIAVPDYSCLFENNSDMMFDAINFGVGLMTDEGYETLGSAHQTYNYAWKYNVPYSDDTEADTRSEQFIDDLEDIIEDYDREAIKGEVDELYDKAEALEADLEDEFETASDTIEDRMTDAAEDAAEAAMDSLTDDEKLDALLDKANMSRKRLALNMILSMEIGSEERAQLAELAKQDDIDWDEFLRMSGRMTGMSHDDLMLWAYGCTLLLEEECGEAFMEKSAEIQATTMTGLIAKELGTTEEALSDMIDSVEDFEDEMDSLEALTANDKDADLDAVADDDYENDMDLSLEPVKELVEKVKATGIYDTEEIENTIRSLEDLSDTRIDEDKILTVEDYVPRYENQAINFTGDDMGSDKAMFIVFDYILTIVIAFVFAVTTLNTISQEAGVIGTLRASGYSRGELLRHYIILPVIVTFAAAVVGNIIGYTVLVGYFNKIYLGSYSFAKCDMLFNANAFLTTTVVPIILMLVINYLILSGKLKLSPLKFLRRDLSRHGRKKAMVLSDKLPFMTRYRLRILFQNVPAYIVLAVGVFLGAIVVIFGLMFVPLLDDYAELVKTSELAKYQYVLKEEIETENTEAEKYCLTSLDSEVENYMTDSISVYGIEKNSDFVKADIPEGEVLVSNGISAKFKLDPGDEVTLKDHYGTTEYTFKIAGVYDYDAALSIFMNMNDYIDEFDEDSDYFTGYFSDEELSDIDKDDIATVITETDLTKASEQLKKSMGEFMSLFEYFGVIIFVLIMFILTKQIIEKNTQSIAMSKILGFSGGEIGKLYLVITSLVVAASLLISIPLADMTLRWVFSDVMYYMMTGYIPYIVSKDCYIKMFLLGILSYAVVAAIIMLKINRIKKSEALKNVE